MNVRLLVLERWLPGRVRLRIVGALARLTADAFGVEAPALAGLRHADAVRSFALFTRSEVNRVLDSGSRATVETVRERLRGRAAQMGLATSRDLHIASRAEALRALRLVYRGIDIDMDVNAGAREIAVRRCAFSGVYAPAVCAFVSALDDGFVRGLTGGGTLEFSERITEGAPCCRARVSGGALP